MQKISNWVKILLDECVPHAVSDFLRSKGFSVKPVSEIDSGAKNGIVYKIATKGFSILITTDRHFRNTLKFPATKTTGIIYVRVKPLISSEIIDAIEYFLSKERFENAIGKHLILYRRGFSLIEKKGT